MTISKTPRLASRPGPALGGGVCRRAAAAIRYSGRVFAVLLALFSWPGHAADVGQALRALADTPFDPAGRDANPPLFNVPRAFAQDRNGLLWAGGQSGLFRWDGYAVTQYVAGGRHPDGLRDHQILALHRDRAGTLWVGSMTGGLARYDQAQDRFVAEPLGFPDAAAAVEVRDIADDGAGGLLLATNTGLLRRAADGRLVWRLPQSELWPAGPDGTGAPAAGGTISLQAAPRAVLRDRQGRIWVGGEAGLAVAAPQAADAAPRFARVALAGPGAAEPMITHLLQDATGAIWVGTHDGAFVLPQGAKSLAASALGAPEAPADLVRIAMPGAELAAHEVMAMAEMAPGEVWIGTYGEGILAVRANGARRRILHDPMQPKGLDSNVVFGLFRDRSGLPWVSTPFGIAHAQAGEGGAIQPLFDHPGAGRGLTVEQPTALLARRDGTLWIGSESDGIEILDASGRQTGHVPVQPVVTLAESPDGRVFAGGRGGGTVIDPDGAHAERLRVPGRGETDTVWALAFEGNRLWLGGDSDGVWVLDVPNGGAVRLVAHVPPPDGQLPRIAAFAPLPDGRMAVATGRGLWFVDPVTFRRTVVLPDPSRSDGLPFSDLGSLATDQHGRLWVGSADAGLAVLTGWAGGMPHFLPLGTEDGLMNPDIDGMLPDENGRMWVSTDSGINVVDTRSFTVRSLSAADGAAVTGFWAGSAARTEGGTFLFGGTGGLLAIDPGLLQATHGAPPVAITRVLAGGKPVGGWQDGVTLPPGTTSLSVDFAALDYAEPGRNHYRYWLDGFDSDWVETDSAHRVAAYTNLPPGDYTLWLSGTDHAGTWSTQLVRLPVRVLPAWYQTLLFKLSVAAAVTGGFLALLHLRTRLLRANQQALERQVAERTAALRESEARLERLANLDALTNLPNRRAFNTALDHCCAQRAVSFALAVVDLDGFKQVNDSLGHHAGDALLQIIAARLRNAVRTTDFVARLGGDEFAILFGDVTEISVAEQTCERVVAELGEKLLLRDRAVVVGASVGVALYPRHGANADALHTAADLAMYDAKRSGRGTWRWFRESLAKAS